MSNIKNDIFKKVFRLSASKKTAYVSPDPRYRASLKRKIKNDEHTWRNTLYGGKDERITKRHITEPNLQQKIKLKKHVDELETRKHCNGIKQEGGNAVKRIKLEKHDDKFESRRNGCSRTTQKGANVANNGDNKSISLSSPLVNRHQKDYESQLRKMCDMIMALDDDGVQDVVDVVAEADDYYITSRTFDFDLTKLKQETIHKIQNILMKSLTHQHGMS